MLVGQDLYVPGIWIGMLIYAPHRDLRMFFTLWTRQVMGCLAIQCPHLSGIRTGLLVVHSSSGVLMRRRWLNCNPVDLNCCFAKAT